MTFDLKQYENSKRIETEIIEDFVAPFYLDDFIKFFQDRIEQLSDKGRPWLDFDYNEWDDPQMLQLRFGYERPKTEEELKVAKELDELHAKNKRATDINMLKNILKELEINTLCKLNNIYTELIGKEK